MTTATETRIEIPTYLLREAVSAASTIVPTRTPKPVLCSVCLVGNRVRATDLELWLDVEVDGLDAGEGICLPAEKLKQVLDASTGSTTTIEHDGGTATIVSDGVYKLFGYPIGEFPPAPAFENPVPLIDEANLRAAFESVMFAMARENTRYAMNGVLLDRCGTQLRTVATDGRSLALYGSATAKAGLSAILPARAVSSLYRLLDGNGDETVRIAKDGQQVQFIWSDYRFATNLVEGVFPPFADVIPRDGGTLIRVEADKLKHGLSMVRIATTAESKGVRVNIDHEAINLSAKSPDVGECDTRVGCHSVKGDGMELGLNADMLLAALRNVTGEVEIQVTTPKHAVRVKQNDWTYVQMPVNLA